MGGARERAVLPGARVIARGGDYLGRSTGTAASSAAAHGDLPGLILASRSPQRRAILEQLGVQFRQVVPEVPELTSGPPHELAVENAYRKAAAVADGAADAIVLGVDTIVSLGPRVYGKPQDVEDARATLRALAGRKHVVISGVCVIEPGAHFRTAAATTLVEFRAFGEALLHWYLSSGEWRGRAGGYAIQGRGAALVAAIEGDYLNVVGLPVATLLELAPAVLDVQPNM